MSRMLIAKKLINLASKLLYGGQYDSYLNDRYNILLTGNKRIKVAQVLVSRFRVADDLCHSNPEICEGNLGIPRSHMPQIKSEYVPEFLEMLEKKGITIHKNQKIQVGKLKATQREMQAEKIEKLKSAPMAKLQNKPILVSKDNHILDGHHRWAALLLLDPKNTINCHKIDLPVRQLLKETMEFDKTFSADLDGNAVAAGSK